MTAIVAPDSHPPAPIDGASPASDPRPRVLIVAGDSFPPMPTPGSMRMVKFARYLPQNGWRPIVLTTDQRYEFEATFEVPDHPDIRIHRTRQIDPIKRAFFLRRRTHFARQDAESLNPVQRAMAGLKRGYPNWVYPDRDWLWYPVAVLGARSILASPDRGGVRAIVSTSPSMTSHRVAKTLAARYDLPWVADFRDFWAFSTLRPPRPRWRRTLERRLEQRVCRAADRVVTISDPYAARLAREHGLSPEKIATIPNGFDPSDFPPFERPTKASARFSIAHAGSFYGGERDPSPLFRVLRSLADSGGIDLADVDLDFYGPRCPVTATRAETHGLGGVVQWRGFINFTELLPRLMDSYLLLVVAHSTDDTVTSKVFDYMGCHRPIVALAPAGGSLEAVLETGGVGQSFDHQDERGLARALATWWTRWRGGDPAAVATSAPALSRYSRVTQAAQLGELLTQLVEADAARG